MPAESRAASSAAAVQTPRCMYPLSGPSWYPLDGKVCPKYLIFLKLAVARDFSRVLLKKK